MPEKTIWAGDGRVFILDQTLLPRERVVLEIGDVGQMWEAIKVLRVRGAPAIGIAAAFGVWLAIRAIGGSESAAVQKVAAEACAYLRTARPTAVNLFWALDRIERLVSSSASLNAEQLKQRILAEAEAMIAEDNEVCLAIGRYGSELLPDKSRVLTHCNAGGLATAQYGTALAVIYWAVQKDGKSIEVFADETRPLLQGARLTAWELTQSHIPVTLICDNMAASAMRKGMIDAVIVGTDRVARNGDFANKIGTYGVAVLARHHGIPFYVAAPMSSIDLKIASGDEIPIEERAAEEIASIQGVQIAPAGVNIYNPAFDVTPAEFVTGFITEKGVVRAPYGQTIPELFHRGTAVPPADLTAGKSSS